MIFFTTDNDLLSSLFQDSREPGNSKCSTSSNREEREQGKVWATSSNTTLCFTMGDRFHLFGAASTLVPVVLCMLTFLPHSLLGNPVVSTEEENSGSSALLRRVKRGWVWNQFFVLEEYTGLEPLYIGKVSKLHMICDHIHTQTCAY